MKKTGILTFHWAANYGAVLQAYALQTYLSRAGHDAEIIDYRPGRVLLIQHIVHFGDLAHGRKERALRRFRENLKLSPKTVRWSRDLKAVLSRYDHVIAGSDQVWNESFTLGAEGKPTLSYFFHGCPPGTKRISYAASFGAESVCEEYAEYVKPELAQFSAISVRERSGQEIVRSLGMDAQIVCDPTLLLTKEDYQALAGEVPAAAPRVFAYILHGHREAAEVASYVKRQLRDDSRAPDVCGLHEWLSCIRYSEVVVTNSFHCVMLSMILNRPFIAVLIKGSGMNDRIRTVLSDAGLADRAVDTCSEAAIDALLAAPIPWEQVNARLDALREHGRAFLKEVLSDGDHAS